MGGFYRLGLEVVNLASIHIPLTRALTAKEAGKCVDRAQEEEGLSCSASQGGSELGSLEAQQGVHRD